MTKVQKLRKVYWNGSFVNESDAKISIYDSALMFGDMVFEMTRSFNKKQWKLKEHIERLYSGIKILKIPIKMTPSEMETAVYETIEVNQSCFDEDDEHRIMIDVSRGLLSIYEDSVDVAKGPNIIIADFPLKWTLNGFSKLYKSGVSLMTPSQRAIPSTFLDPKIKNRSRLFYLMANLQVSQFKGENNWALLLDQHGFITEGTGCNFFMIKNKKIYTPPAGDLLIGITRNTIINDIAPSLNLEVIEKNIEPFELFNADESFLTATPFCILPATKFNDTIIGDGNPGEITHKLLNKWSELVNLDILKKMESWDNEDQKIIKGTSPYKFK